MRRIESMSFRFMLCAVVAMGCTTSPVGDPCLPESIPAAGFDSREISLETNSAQCRTSICMVYRLEGDPSVICSAEGEPSGCVTEAQRESQVSCSCRCSVPDGVGPDVPLCQCGEGFLCDEDVVGVGEPNVRGGYCVPCIEPGNPRALDVAVFDRCPVD